MNIRKNNGSTTIKGADGKITSNIAADSLTGPATPATVGPTPTGASKSGVELSDNAMTHLGSGELPDGWSFAWDEDDYLATVTTPNGSYLNYILARGTLQVWWVESKSKGEGTALISDAVERTGVSLIVWGETTESGLALAKSWHRSNPDGPPGVCADDYGEDISVLEYVPLPPGDDEDD